MKGQSLPMQTIAIIIIVLIVLAGVVIFFYLYYSKGRGITGTQTNYSNCKTICMNVQADISNGECQKASTLESQYWGSGKPCNQYTCKVTLSSGSEVTLNGNAVPSSGC